MKIQIEGVILEVALAEIFAEEIHAAVVRQHLRAVGYNETVRDAAFFAVKKAIASIEDVFERRQFIASVGYHFRKSREKRGTQVTTREYVRRVNSCRQREGALAA